MNQKDLQNLFEQHGKSNRHFIDWASRVCGVTFNSSEITKHRRGKKISKPVQAMYRIYFKLLELQ